jgi:hypothetical protein
MCKLSLLLLLGATAALAISTSVACARGGTYHHSDFAPLSANEKGQKPTDTRTRHYHRGPSSRFLHVPDSGVRTKPKAQ